MDYHTPYMPSVLQDACIAQRVNYRGPIQSFTNDELNLYTALGTHITPQRQGMNYFTSYSTTAIPGVRVILVNYGNPIQITFTPPWGPSQMVTLGTGVEYRSNPHNMPGTSQLTIQCMGDCNYNGLMGQIPIPR